MQAKLAFVLVLLLSKALTAADWKIRLYWVHPPAEARVTVQGRPSVTLHAASAPVRFNRPLTLEVTGYEPLRLDVDDC